MTNEIDRFFNSTIGYHPILRMMNNLDNVTKFPPANIGSYKDKNDNTCIRVDLALAGWSSDELRVEFGNKRLTVHGNPIDAEEENFTFHHRGIAKRSFIWERIVSEDLEIGNVVFSDGLLSIWMTEIVPETKKIKQIPIDNKFRSLEAA